MRNLGVKDILVKEAGLTLDNERKTWTEKGLEDLLNSIKRTGGNITPCIAELLEPPEKGVRYRILGGNRRYLCHTILGMELIKVRILTNLTEEDRIRIQLIENVTKRKIPPYEIADNYWGLYTIFIANHLGIRKLEDVMEFTYPDYWSIPEALRKKFTIGQFASIVKKDPSTIKTAFLYQKLNKSLRKLIEDGKIAYTIAAEFGRIDNKNDQIVEFARASRAVKGRLNRSYAKKHLKWYFINKQPRIMKQVLTMEKIKTPDRFKGFSSKLAGLVKFLRKIQFMVEVDDDFLFQEYKILNGSSIKEVSLNSIIKEVYSKTEKVKDVSKAFLGYIAAVNDLKERKQKKSSLTSRILQGELVLKSDEKRMADLNLEKAEYLCWVDIGKIYPCINQPRKTFDEASLKNMADTIEEYGILQPIMVRPKDSGAGKGKFEIIVGESRYRAAKKAGLKGLDVLCCPMSDFTAQMVRYEEDLFEEVLLSERAEKLTQFYEQKKEVLGKVFTLSKFVSDLKGIGTSIVLDALKYASLDKYTKHLHNAGLISYTHAIALQKIEKVEKRYQYAFTISLLNKSVSNLNKMIYDDLYQRTLPFFEDNPLAERIKNLKQYAVQLLGDKAMVLDNSLMMYLTRKEHFKYILEISDIIGKIYEITS